MNKIYDDYLNNIFNGVDSTIKLDEEQKEAILNEDKNLMIIAGAGSGKTTTLSAKVKFLVEIKKVNPKDIIMISYTNKAVFELRQKINKEFNIPIEICTFHKFGLNIIKQKNKNIKILSDRTKIITEYVDNIFKNDKHKYQQFLEFFACYFDKENNIYHKSLKNEKMMHFIDIQIANYLYVMGIKYLYHKKYNRKCTPDFTLPLDNDKIYIQIYRNTFSKLKIRKIHKFYQRKKLNVIELCESDDILDNLKVSLQNYNIKYHNEPLTKNSKYHKFVIFCNTFITSFKTNGYTDFLHFKTNKRIALFLEFMKGLYDYYQQFLINNQMIDFEDMINNATKCLENYSSNYKYVIIDEYQDISIERFKLVKNVSKNANIVVVGDDWQAIFAFAGSNVTLFTEFKNLMTNATELKITHTYRNSQELINIAGNFVMKNHHQIQKQLFSNKHNANPVKIVYYQNKLKCLNKIIDDIVKSYGINKSILLIGRYSFDKNFFLNNGYIETNGLIKSEKYPQLKLSFLTAHASKGLGFDNVIIVNSLKGQYGFPSMVLTDEILRLVEVKPDDFAFSEERRLFYVAMTRTKNEVYILSENDESQFVKELIGQKGVEIINKRKNKHLNICPICGFPLHKKIFKTSYVCTNKKGLCNFETNNM